jgi:hypothetical protein
MSAEWSRAAAVSLSSAVTAAQPALARSVFTIARTCASKAALPVGGLVVVGGSAGGLVVGVVVGLVGLVGSGDGPGVLVGGTLGGGPDGEPDTGGGDVGRVGGRVGADGSGTAVAVVPGSPGVVPLGTAVGGVPSVVMTSLSMSGAAPVGLPKVIVFLPETRVAVNRRVPGRLDPRVPGNCTAVEMPPFTLIWAVRVRALV